MSSSPVFLFIRDFIAWKSGKTRVGSSGDDWKGKSDPATGVEHNPPILKC
jgi:hypothetical protein